MSELILLPGFTAPSEKSVVSLPADLWTCRVEPFGRGYEKYSEYVVHGWSGYDNEELQNEEENEEEDQKYKGHKKKTTGAFVENYYELLGLGEVTWRATQEDIKKAHRKAALLHHPDKQTAAEDDNDEMFKKIQLAYETLSDPKKRRIYDSQEAFDDTIPDADDVSNDEEFYEVFKPVFERNAKWSLSTRVPGLGDSKTPWDTVSSFYSFWYSFKSWRDFAYLDEYDPEDAESREEKRWMERKNKKNQEKKRNEEQARINALVDLAYKLDPRVRIEREKERQEREESKRKRMERIKQRKEEEERKIREEKEREEEEQRKIKAEEEALKKEQNRINKERNTKKNKMKQIAEKVGASLENIEFLSVRYDLEELDSFFQRFNKLEQKKEVIDKFLNDATEAYKKQRQEKEKQQKQNKPQEAAAQWTSEEIDLLTRALVKFPVGTKKRWDVIADFIGTKNSKQVIARVKQTNGGGGEPVRLEDQYERWMKSRKDTNVVSEPSKNWDAISKAQQSTPTPTATPATPAAKTPQSTTATKSTTTASATPPASAPTKEWSAEEQKSLEIALKTYPASLGADRWAKIAAEVPGRSKKECIDRYKYIVNIIKQSKAKQ